MTDAAEKAAQLSRDGKITLPAYSMLALALIGIAAALYVAHGNYTGQSLWCPILDGCNAVVNSPYSRVFGVPMSYFGFIYFLYMFALAARLVSSRSRGACACARFSTPRWAPFLRCTSYTCSCASFANSVVTA